MIKTKTRTVLDFLYRHRAILILMLVLFAERFVTLKMLGSEYSLMSDDLSYVASGITFAKTGSITMHGTLSAQIMPGMTVLIALFSFVFGEGHLLWVALKLLWITMGTLAAWFIYRSVGIFAPKWCGVIAASFLILPDFVWEDNLILTETPFLLLLTVMIYATLKMGKDGGTRWFVLCLVSYFLALMLKANIGIYPVFAAVYLLIVKYDFKRLLRQGLILGAAVLCFVIPWSVRNYIHFDAFVPLTYGAGNPQLLGTYQGYGYPEDAVLDYKTNVDDVAAVKYAKYYNDDGTIDPYLARYVSLETDGIKARYRMSEWWDRDPASMLDSYLVQKPKYMLFSSFCWDELFPGMLNLCKSIRYVDFALMLLGAAAALIIKKYRAELLFLALTYFANIYIYATTFSFERYSQPLQPLRYIMVGLGISAAVSLVVKLNGQKPKEADK